MVLRIEDISFIGVYVNDSFRDFKDINDYANYHVSLLNNKRYQAFSGGDFIDRVVKGGYATDPNYKRALSNVYNQIAKAQEGMKIPKLKGAGELRARILRQFNREKAANRNEEQLIGFDWSRYKSNKPKPETTPTQSEQLENGGVIKYQEPSSGIQRNNAIRTETDKNVSKYNRAVYSSVNPIWGVPSSIIQAGRLATQARIKSWKDDQDNMDYSVGTQIGDSVADAAWRKRLGLSYDSKFLPKFNGDTVRLPKQLEMEIPTDTNVLKKRIARTEELIHQSPKYRNSKVIDVALRSDQRALEALRKTYETGNPVGIDEYSNNSRQLVDNGIINENYVSPLNVFRNYNIRYDKPTNKMYYSKSYDFDTMEHNWDKFVPGDKFYIRGSIDLNKKK